MRCPVPEMRALTLRQPWPWAIAEQGKNVENRPWRTRYRGLLAIHAGRALDGDVNEIADAMLDQMAARALRAIAAECTLAQRITDRAKHMRLSRIHAVAELAGCHHSDECMLPASAVIPGTWTGCSRWAVRGQWHFELRNVHALAEPVPCHPGKLGLWRLPDEVESAVRAQLEASHA